MQNKSYGFCYDKQGNLKEVSAPVNAIATKAMYPDHNPNPEPVIAVAKKHRKTLTGGLHASVGFSASK
jgi:hypothetical protein